MGEAIRNVLILLWAVSAINSSAYATDSTLTIEEEANDKTPTIIVGIAKNAEGGDNEDIIEQNGDNILGNPMPEVIKPNMPKAEPEIKNSSEKEKKLQNSPIPEGDFQNTLMEANGMVYDVQAFPESDMPVISNPSNPETIYSPNVNN